MALRGAVRDIRLHHVGTDGTPQERVAGARQILKQIAEGVGDTEPYGLLVRREAERIARLPASYVLGEFLSPDNHPMHFREFVALAGEHGFTYLCEGTLASSISESLFPEAEGRLRAMSGPNLLDVEQYKDYFTGRPFRRSVLTKSRAPNGAATVPSSDRLRSLHLASPLQPDLSESDEHLSVYSDDQGRRIRVEDSAPSPSSRPACGRVSIDLYSGAVDRSRCSRRGRRRSTRLSCPLHTCCRGSGDDFNGAIANRSRHGRTAEGVVGGAG